jgi:hypothetical protein
MNKNEGFLEEVGIYDEQMKEWIYYGIYFYDEQ